MSREPAATTARPDPVVPSADMDWATRVQRLEAEVAGLRRAMASRGVIEQAKGALAVRLGCAPEDAFAHLSKLSQESNVRLADVAAGLVAALGPEEGTEPEPLTGLPRAADYREVAAAAADAPDLRALAGALCTAARFSAFVDPAANEPLAGAGEFPRDAVVAAGHRAAGTGMPVWSGPPGARIAAYPLRAARGAIGAVVFGVPGGGDAAEDRAFYGALAQLAQRLAASRWAGGEPLLDTTYTPAMLLTPVRDPDGAVVDFLIAYANPAVPSMAGLSRDEQIGRRLLDTYPHLGANGVFAAFVDVLDGGGRFERDASIETAIVGGVPVNISVARRAVRHGDAVLATWLRDDDRLNRERRLRRMEALGRFGWGEFDLVGRGTTWSPGLYAVTGRDESSSPVAFASLPGLAIEEDAAALARMVDDVSRGRAAAAEFRLVPGRPGGRAGADARHVRLIAEPVATDAGRVIGALAIAQDLTESRRADERMLRVQAQLAEQRMSNAAQRELTRELRRVLYPGEVCDVRTPAARLVGRHVAGDDERLRGDFCDATLLDDGHLLFAVGDCFGSGARAGEVLARLLYPARALGNAGVAPADVLRILNADLHRDAAPPLASMVVGRFCPVEWRMTWAQAGHLPPVPVWAGKGAPLVRPDGTALGLLADVRYGQERVDLRDGDVIAWMTDGMVYDRSRPDSDPWPAVRQRLVTAHRTGGVDAMLDLCRSGDGDEACMLVLAVTGSNPGGGARCASPACGAGQTSGD